MLLISNEPLLEISLDSSGKRPIEPWLDTIHIEIRNTGYKWAGWIFKTQNAQLTRAWIILDRHKTHKDYLIFETGYGAQPSCVIGKKEVIRIPLFARTREVNNFHFHELPKDKCYITGASFYGHKTYEATVGVGEHEVTVKIELSSNKVVTRYFILTVPEPEKGLPLTLQFANHKM